MAKKATTKKKAHKAESTNGHGDRHWNQTYTLRKAAKAEPRKDTIAGAVYGAIAKIKSGSIDDIHALALKNGLADVTGQDTRVQTMVWLRRFAAEGLVEIERETKTGAGAQTDSKPAKKAKKGHAKAASAPKKRRVRLVESGASEGDAASA